jgi:hypothetical protein
LSAERRLVRRGASRRGSVCTHEWSEKRWGWLTIQPTPAWFEPCSPIPHTGSPLGLESPTCSATEQTDSPQAGITCVLGEEGEYPTMAGGGGGGEAIYHYGRFGSQDGL